MKDSLYLQGSWSLVGEIGKLDEYDRYMGRCLKFEQELAQQSRGRERILDYGNIKAQRLVACHV